ncbi:MAG: ATP synthase subunit I [Desulfovibrio sp.]|jgi:hypothetical protein|nr:ATP synthase subunit I [Desulfovibrio sp.]
MIPFPRMYTGLRGGIERRLPPPCFASPALRGILRALILAAGAACSLGAVLFVWSPVPLAFGAGAAISVLNFLHSARFVQAHMSERFTVALHLRLFFGFCARLVLTGIALYLLLIPCSLPAIPLLLGLGSTVVGIVVWSLLQMSGKSFKEA